MKNLERFSPTQVLNEYLDPNTSDITLENGNNLWSVSALLDMIPDKITYKSRSKGEEGLWFFQFSKKENDFVSEYVRFGYEGIEEAIPYPEMTEDDRLCLATYGMVFGSDFGGVTSSNSSQCLTDLVVFLIRNNKFPGKYLFGKKKKLEILNEVLDNINKSYTDEGISYHLMQSLYKRLGCYCMYDSQVEIFPQFIPETFGITIPEDSLFGNISFWWKKEDKESRIKALEKLIDLQV